MPLAPGGWTRFQCGYSLNNEKVALLGLEFASRNADAASPAAAAARRLVHATWALVLATVIIAVVTILN